MEDTRMEKVFCKMQRFLESRVHMLVILALAMIATVFSLENYFIPLAVLWIVFVLLVNRSFTELWFPILILNAVALRTATQGTYLFKHVWLAIPVVLAIVLHFVLYRRNLRIGKMFPALCAVSAALLLGGIGKISVKEYFAPGSSLYYILFLGVGMVFFYVWMRNAMYSTESYDLKERMLEILYLLGVFCAFSMLEKAVRMHFAYGGYDPFKWCNDICEMMLFALPVPFYFARRRLWHAVVPFIFYVCMISMRSMAAILVGAVILCLGMLYMIFYAPRFRVLFIVLLSVLTVGGVGVFAISGKMNAQTVLVFFAEEENGRLDIYRRAWEGFLSSPVLGVGMGYRGEAADTMSTLWAHNWFLQILGSMGLLGFFAYGYQTFIRVKLIFVRKNAFKIMMGLSYCAIFLVSMLQPGEFCPMPYELLAVALFVVLEITENGDTRRISLDKTY